MVIWVTGLSSAGKTTICSALFNILKPVFTQTVFIDSESIRGIFDEELGFSEGEKIKQVQRVQKLTQMLENQKLIVIVTILYSNPDLLNWNRKNFNNYFEVYLQASLEMLRSRDPKKIYAEAAQGEMKNVVGLDIPWQPPLSPDLTIDNNLGLSPDAIVKKVISAIPHLNARITLK